jgi:hypothetical protein
VVIFDAIAMGGRIIRLQIWSVYICSSSLPYSVMKFGEHRNGPPSSSVRNFALTVLLTVSRNVGGGVDNNLRSSKLENLSTSLISHDGRMVSWSISRVSVFQRLNVPFCLNRV